ncbi:MAG TPA: glycosyltransferase [Acidimicrobiales bacterium]|nr:glycosyltransferase [Acidimicrobiales bacterium]
MRVLVVCIPVTGHVNPLLPLIDAFAAAGDEVLVASGPQAHSDVVAAGAKFTPAGRGFGDWFERLTERTRAMPGDGVAPERILSYFLPRVFGEAALDDMVDGVLGAATEFGPDVVVFDTFALAAPLVADIVGVPSVQVPITLPLPSALLELIDDAVCPMWRAFGRVSPGLAGVYRGLTADIWPGGLNVRDVDAGARASLRPCPLPIGPAQPTEVPTVYVTLGTMYGGATAVFAEVLRGLASAPVQVVVTVGADQDPRALDGIAANARIERYVPHDELLPACSAVVHHGGSGTMFGALAHGLPQVVLPQGADNYVNGDAVAAAGLGVTLRPNDVSAEAIRDAVDMALHDGSVAASARRVAEEIAAMPSHDDFAAVARSLAT